MNGTARNRTIRLSAALALCQLGLECGEKSPASPTPVGPAQGSPSPTPPHEPGPDSFRPLAGGAELFVGACDIATGDPIAETTARLLDWIPGTVFTLGYQAYPRGAAAEYRFAPQNDNGEADPVRGLRQWEFIPVSGQGDRGMGRCH